MGDKYPHSPPVVPPLLHRTTDLINRIEWLFLYKTLPRFEVSVSFYRKQVRPEIEQVYAGHYSTGTALPSNKWGEGWKKRRNWEVNKVFFKTSFQNH